MHSVGLQEILINVPDLVFESGLVVICQHLLEALNLADKQKVFCAKLLGKRVVKDFNQVLVIQNVID